MREAARPALDLRRSLARGIVVVLGTLALLALLVLALLRSDVGRHAIADVWHRAEPLGLLASIVLMSLATPCVAFRWRALVPGRQGSGLVMTGFLCAGLVFNYALPGPVGEVAAAVMLRRRYGVALPDALASLAVSRIVGLGSACGLAGLLYVTLPLEVPSTYSGALTGAAWVLLVGGGGLLTVALAPQIPTRLVLPLIRPLDRLPGRLGVFGAKVRDGLVDLLDALVRTARRGWGAYAEAIAWSFAGHLAVSTGIAVAAWSLGLDPPWAGVVFTYAAATGAAVVLFLFPGSHLGWDVTFGSLLALSTGVPATDAAALTVVVRVQQSLIVLAGVAALWFLGRDLLPEAAEVEDALER